MSAPLSDLIKQQCADYSVKTMEAQVVAKQEVHKETQSEYNSVADGSCLREGSFYLADITTLHYP